jgi:hypothetical protein
MGRNKTKNGRSLNPADAFRKQQRQKEIKKNKIQKQKVRTLILQTKTSSKIQDQINEITRLEQSGDQDKKHKAKKKILQDTLAKVIELEKLKGDNLQEEDLMAIPNYIDFSQGTITLSDKPKERAFPPMPTPLMNGMPGMPFMNGLPLPPQGPSPFDLPPPPDIPLPPDPYGALEQPPVPSDEPNDFQPPLPDGPAPLAPNFQPFPPTYYNQPNPNFPFGQPMPQGLAPFGAPINPLLPVNSLLTPLPPKTVTSTTTTATPTASTITATTITSQPVLIAADEKKFIGVPSALRVKRVQSAMMPQSLTKKKARIDTVAAAIVSSYRPAVNPNAQQIVREQIQAQQQQKEQEKLEEIEDDFEKYMDEMNALGVL